MKFGILFDLVLFLALTCNTGFCQEEKWNEISSLSEDQAIEIGSFADAVFANNSAWENGDFLLRVDTLWDSTDYQEEGRMIIEQKDMYRLRFDYEKEHFAFVHFQKIEIPVLVFPDSTPMDIESESSIRGFVKNENGVFFRDFPNKVKQYKKLPEHKKLFSRFFVPELRNVGIIPFNSPTSFADLEPIIKRQSSGEGIANVNERSGNKLEWLRRTSVPGKDGLYFIQETVFDIADNVPLKEVVSVESNVNDKLQKNKQYEEIYEWAEINGINVPVSIYRECMSPRRIGTHEFLTGKTIEATITWLDLNSESEANDFDEELLREFDSLVRFVDEKSLKKQSIFRKEK